MKTCIRFVVWYLLMWLAILPTGWYFMAFANSTFEIVRIASFILYPLIGLMLILSQKFRIFIWQNITFPFQVFTFIESSMEAKKLNRIKQKNYVYQKKNNPASSVSYHAQ